MRRSAWRRNALFLLALLVIGAVAGLAIVPLLPGGVQQDIEDYQGQVRYLFGSDEEPEALLAIAPTPTSTPLRGTSPDEEATAEPSSPGSARQLRQVHAHSVTDAHSIACSDSLLLSPLPTCGISKRSATCSGSSTQRALGQAWTR